MVWGVAAAAAVGATLLVTPAEHVFSPGRPPELGIALGVAFVTAGLLAWRRRPHNRIGLLLTLTGGAWLLPALSGAESPLLFTVGVLTGSLAFAFVAWLVLAYPTGTLEFPVHRVIVAAAFALTTAGYALSLLFSSRDTLCSGPCPDNVLLVSDRAGLADDLRLGVESAGAALAIATIATIVRRWHRSTPAQRRVLTPVYASGGAAFAAIGVTLLLEAVDRDAYDVARWVTAGVLLTLPVGFLVGVLRTRLARAAVSRLLLEVPDEPTPEEAQAGVRTVLGDPTAELLVWSPEHTAYVDADGLRRDAPDDGNRGVTPIGYGDRPIALLSHDRALLEEPELLEEVAATIRVGLEKDRTLRVLRASERRSRALLRAMPDVMYRIRRDGTYIDFHANDPRDLLAPPDSIVGSSVRENAPPELAERFMAGLEAALDTGEVQTLEYTIKRPFRGVRDAETRIVRSGEDEVVVIVRDVTERKRQQEVLERERDFQRRAINATPSLFAVLDDSGGTIFFNVALERLSGYTNDDSIDPNPFWELFLAPEDRDEAKQAIAEVAATREPVRRESTWLTLDGGRRTVSWILTPLVNEEGTPRILLTGLDITDRKLQEEEIERERDFVRNVVRVAPSIFAVVGPFGEIDRFNDACSRVTGLLDDDNVRGRPFWEAFLPKDEETVARDALEEVKLTGVTTERECDWLDSRTGERRTVTWALTPIVDARGRQRYLLTGLDITDRKLGERRTSALLEAVPDTVYRLHRDGTYLDFHSNDERDLVAPPDQIIGRNLRELAPPQLVEPLEAAMEATLETGDVQTIEYDIERPGKGWRNVETRVVRAGDDEIVGIVRDVTERRSQEEEIRRSRARIVEAGDQARKRLERNLHDGAQQRLVSLSIALRLATAKLRDDPDAAESLMTTATEELSLALEELRELARGIHPAILTDRGLVPALEMLARRTSVPVDLCAELAERLPPPVEAAAYYIVSEALTNASKHAGAARVRVDVRLAGGAAHVEVTDDGVGGADERAGSGLRGLADRVEALGGQLELHSPPGTGTTLRARLPCG